METVYALFDKLSQRITFKYRTDIQQTLTVASNMGIGTTAPASALHVVGNVQADTAALTTLNTSNAVATSSVQASRFITTEGLVRSTNATNFRLQAELGSAFDVVTGGFARLQIAANGAVTIPPTLSVGSKATFDQGADIRDVQVLELGKGIPGKEPAAGHIGYQTYSSNLDVVGAGTVAGSRKVKLWDSVEIPQDVTASNVITSNLTAGAVYSENIVKKFGLLQGEAKVTRIYGTLTDLNADHFEITGSAFPVTGFATQKEFFTATVAGDVTTVGGRVMEYTPVTTAFNDVWLHEWWDDLGEPSGVLVLSLRADDDATLYYCGARVLDLNGNTTRETVVPIQRYAHFQVVTRNGAGASVTRVKYFRF